MDSRYLCERCGGMGKQEAGLYNVETKKYDAPAGICDDCGGEGYLGEIKRATKNDDTDQHTVSKCTPRS